MVEFAGEEVGIGEDSNLVVLTRAVWNILVAAAMATSSVSVLTNALRLRGFKAKV